MSMRILLPAITAIALTIVALISFARSGETGAGDLAITLAWARATPPGAKVAAAYVRVENRSQSTDRLLGIESPAAEAVELHETVEEGGIAKMRPLDGIKILAGETLAMEPGGIHLMLTGLTAPLEAGETLLLTLTFEQAGSVAIEAEVRPIGAAAPADSDDSSM
jgi:copper(I)-binding protein